MEKRLPDGPGHWANDKGETCHIVHGVSGYWYVQTADTCCCTGNVDLNTLLVAKGISLGRWKKMELPEFEPLPELRAVLAKWVYSEGRTIKRGWFVQHDDSPGYFTGPWGVAVHSSRLTVIPHPDNHPEAEKEIEDA